ncbi:1,4-dihydroxy-2-naphthoate polyprenyltransferase [Pelotomaculum isophthalicicum JI]|uniref:1,4-dihydroxy-2-naphthoate octaprenyltransferase n=1 Tax=Pelotomaculum isophthalicicum JI TaxID=947010 RepID=A0A9X4H725_9FIRM|nr:1,4-dihydroxy-2-naphthoate polyprenyltransferase [Pelotomaculum isophthalicicum]MDF9409707.1 1,4-dihydroxy-2-naphthoate polyprenyltransferase [Pelotomaculum isophthalicicum JI]
MKTTFQKGKQLLRPPGKSGDSSKVWWRLMRPHTLTASFIPVLIGTSLALAKSGRINYPIFLAMLAACLFIQGATNIFNEYYDFKRGLDTMDSVGIGGAIVRDGIGAKTVFYSAIILLIITVFLGLFISFNSSWLVAIVGAACMLTGYLYSGGPWPIAYTPYGELVAGVFMGPVIILLSFFIQAGTVDLKILLISVPTAVLIGAILMSNNIRDLDGDKKNGRRTLAIILGKDKAVKFLSGMFVFSYAWSLVLFMIVSPWLIMVFASAPLAVKGVRGYHGKTIDKKASEKQPKTVP